MQSRVKKSTINIVVSSLSSVLSILLNYITRLIFVRFLSAAYLGINGLFSNVISILSMADLGLTTAMMFSLFKPLAQNDTEKIKSLVTFFKKVYLSIAFAVLLLGLTLMPFLRFIVNLDQPLDNLYVYYFLFLLETVISYLFIYRTILLSADQKQYILTLSEILLSIAIFVARILVLVFTKNYILYIAVGIILKLICNFIQNFIAMKYYPYLKVKGEKLDKETKSNIFSNVKASFIYRFSATIQTNTDNILISIFAGTIVVGFYSNYLLVVTGIVSCVSIIFNALKSSVGNFLAEENDPDKRYQMFNALEVLNFWIVCFCSVAFMCLFTPFITISYGSDYVLSPLVVVMIVANFYTSNIRQTIWVFREASGLFVQTKYLTLVTAIANIILSIIFGYLWGVVGIIGATVLARFVYSYWKEPLILYKNVFNKSAKKYFITFIIRLIITTALCAGCYYLMILINFGNQIVNLLVQGIVIAIVPNLVLLLIHIKNKNFLFLIKKLKALFFKRKNKETSQIIKEQ